MIKPTGKNSPDITLFEIAIHAIYYPENIKHEKFDEVHMRLYSITIPLEGYRKGNFNIFNGEKVLLKESIAYPLKNHKEFIKKFTEITNFEGYRTSWCSHKLFFKKYQISPSEAMFINFVVNADYKYFNDLFVESFKNMQTIEVKLLERPDYDGGDVFIIDTDAHISFQEKTDSYIINEEELPLLKYEFSFQEFVDLREIENFGEKLQIPEKYKKKYEDHIKAIAKNRAYWKEYYKTHKEEN